MNYEVGDWVSGHSSEGELVRGFIDAVHASQGTVDIFVTDSDREAAIGGVTSLRNQSVRKLPGYTGNDESGLLNYIDMALMTKDEEWFKELSASLAAVRSRKSRQEAGSGSAAKSRNRILFRS